MQVERVLDASTHVYGPSSDARFEITDDFKSSILSQTETLAGQGLRVLALASRRLNGIDTSTLDTVTRDDIENSFSFIGLAGIYDPPRPESVHAIRACKKAGITVHMLVLPSRPAITFN